MATRPQSPGGIVSLESTQNGQRGLVDLTRGAIEDILRLVQQELQLARLELKEMLISSAWGIALLAAAAFCGLLSVVFFFLTIAFMFPLPASPHWLTAGIEAAAFLLLAVILALIGKSRLKIQAPPKTMSSLKEDTEWARHLLRRNGK